MNSSKNKQRTKDKAAKSNVNKRFIRLSSIILLAYLLLTVLLYLKWKTSFFITSLWFLNIGVAIWFFTDYELLQKNWNYLWSLFIAFAIILYRMFVVNEFEIKSIHTSISSSLYATALLLVQWPLRRLFLKVFKVEPEVDRTGNIQNAAYTFILAMGMIIIPFLIEDMVNK